MNTYTIEATLTKTYRITKVLAEGDLEALATLDEWMADDFDDFETGAVWDFEMTEELN